MTDKKIDIRDSNFELLRLVCMFFIIFHHFIVHGLKVAGYWGEDVSGLGFLNSFVIIAVNCFVLISGYFSIKASFRGLVHLYIICLFYKLGINIFAIVYNNLALSLRDVLSSFFALSRAPWFITCYVYLFLLSPMLNKLIEKITQKEYLGFLGLFTLLTFYFGWFWRGSINTNGYNIMNFIYLYLISRYMALYTENIKTVKRRVIYMGIYFLCSILIMGFVVLVSHYKISWIASLGYPYNSPLVIISSVAFFCFFRTLEIKSRVINWLAASVLAIYVIHENPKINTYLYGFIYSCGKIIDNKILLFILFIIFDITIIFVCILIDKMRIKITEPIENGIGKINIIKIWDKVLRRITGL